MKLAEARAYRDRLRAHDVAATVPLGHSPNGYFVKVWSAELHTAVRERYLRTREEVQAFYDKVQENRRASERAAFLLQHPPRSPIEAMVDKAVGLDTQ